MSTGWSRVYKSEAEKKEARRLKDREDHWRNNDLEHFPSQRSEKTVALNIDPDSDSESHHSNYHSFSLSLSPIDETVDLQHALQSLWQFMGTNPLEDDDQMIHTKRALEVIADAQTLGISICKQRLLAMHAALKQVLDTTIAISEEALKRRDKKTHQEACVLHEVIVKCLEHEEEIGYWVRRGGSIGKYETRFRERELGWQLGREEQGTIE